jgi:hypothetical protein
MTDFELQSLVKTRRAAAGLLYAKVPFDLRQLAAHNTGLPDIWHDLLDAHPESEALCRFVAALDALELAKASLQKAQMSSSTANGSASSTEPTSMVVTV